MPRTWSSPRGCGRSPTISTVVRSADGAVSMTDGPYAETKEQMAGIWVIEAADDDEALAWAARAHEACGRPIQVRPFS